MLLAPLANRRRDRQKHRCARRICALLSDDFPLLSNPLGMMESRLGQLIDAEASFMALARPIVFMHVPKAGGTTVREELRCWFPQAQHVQFTSPQMCDELSDQDLSRIEVFTGHIGFRFLQRVPTAIVVTFLRDPLERAVSQYWYHRHNLNTFRGRQLSFAEYLRSDISGFRAVLDNGIVWQFAWDQHPAFRDEVRFSDDDCLFKEASANIQSVDFIGFQESLDQDIELLREYLGVVTPRHPARRRANVTLNKPDRMRLTDADVAVFQQRAGLDIRFLEEARRLVAARRAAFGGLPVRSPSAGGLAT
jgi:hypothetical protein